MNQDAVSAFPAPVGSTPDVGGVVVPAAGLHRFVQDVFESLAMRPDDAAELADHLVWADLRGSAALGARKVPQYVARIKAGGTSPNAVPVVLQDRGAFALIDAKDTFGQVVGARAMRRAVEKARAFGVGAVSVRDTTSGGALGYYAMLAAEEGMIGFAVNNSPAVQTAWGGREKVLGNQAFAVGSPAGRHDPLLLDMATSAISWARIHEYEAAGKDLPEGLALSPDGEPTVDPATAIAGVLLPMGGHRGSGLAVMWEILTGGLSGGMAYSDRIDRMPDHLEVPTGISIFCLAVNPEFSIPYEEFLSRVDAVIDRIKASARAPGVSEIRMPGERGYATAAQRRQDGIPLPAGLVESLMKLGTELGVEWRWPR